MKVPVYQQQVQPGGAGVPRSISTGPGDAGFGAIAQGAAAIGGAADMAYREYEMELQKKRVADARDELTQYERDTTQGLYGNSSPKPNSGSSIVEGGEQGASPTPGFLSTRGKAAADSGGAFLDDLAEKRRARAEKIEDPETRALFLRTSADAYEGTRKQVEGHVLREIERAKEDSVKAAADEAVRAAAVDPANDDLAGGRIAQVSGAISMLSTSPEDATRRTTAVHADVAEARLGALLARGDWKEAERVFADNKHVLGAKVAPIEKAIETARKGAEAEVRAGQIVSSATSVTGEVNQAAVLAKLRSLPGDEQKALRPIVYQQMAEQEQAYAADVKRVSTGAFSLYNSVGWAAFAKTPIAEELNQRNPELYNRLQNDAQSEFDRLERKRRNTADDRRHQTSIDNIALNTFLGMKPEERAAADTAEWAQGRGMSDEAKSNLLKLKESAREVVEKGQAASENEFVNRAIADAAGTLDTGTDPKAKGRRKAQELQIEAEARRKYSQWIVEHEGKPPTDTEIAEMSGKIATQRPPVGDAGASQQADLIIRKGTQKAIVLPEIDLSGGSAPKPSKAQRAKALKAEGLSNADIAKKMTEEGY